MTWTNDDIRRTALLLLICPLLAAWPARSHAAELFASERSLTAHQFIWRSQTVAAGATATIETRNTTAGGDPVMQVFSSSGQPIPWVFADDSGGTLNPKLTIAAPASGSTTYRILVRAFSTSTGGKTDLFVNGTRVLTQVTFGGVKTSTTWSAGQDLVVTGSQRGTGNDTLVFPIDAQPYGGGATIGAVGVDDDSGPNAYSKWHAASASSSSASVVWGLYPNSTGSGHFAKHTYPFGIDCLPDGSDCWPICYDSDGDCVSDGLEAQVGTLSNDWDSDNDHIPDAYELFGNDGFSMSEGQNNPTRGNLYVEVDFMKGSGVTDMTPYAALRADVAQIFNTDGAKTIDVLVDTALPYTQVIKYGSCSGSCVNFYTLKSANFAPNDAIRRAYSHYVIFGAQHTSSTSCSSGLAEVLGNDAIVSLDRTAACAWGFTTKQQRGTFMHEFGHNLNLTHRGNDRKDGQNGTGHKSVMNYRYQNAGVDTRSGVFQASYSFGTNGCTPCATSPKKACVDLRNAGQCNTSAGSDCDCDFVEWSRLDLDFSENPGEFADGSPMAGTEDPAATDRRRTRGSDKDLGLRPDSRKRPEETASERRERIARRIERFRAQGRREGVDFQVSEDGEHLYAVE